MNVAELLALLIDMSSRDGRHKYDIGDYWNACDLSIETLTALDERVKELRYGLNHNSDLVLALQAENERLQAAQSEREAEADKRRKVEYERDGLVERLAELDERVKELGAKLADGCPICKHNQRWDRS